MDNPEPLLWLVVAFVASVALVGYVWRIVSEERERKRIAAIMRGR